MLKGEDAALLAEARTRLTGIQTNLPHEIPAAGVSKTAKIPFNAICCREGLIWRAEELARSACDSFEKLDMVAGISLTRGFFETAAALWHLKETMDRQLKNGIEPDLELQIQRVILGHGGNTNLPKAINVLTFMDRLTKSFPLARKKYDMMSEYAHPNWMGAAFPFSVIDRENLVVTFGRGLRGVDYHAKLGLTCLIDGLHVAELAYNGIADVMPKFITLCEEDLLTRQ
jgi:hypothetical protein